MLKPMLMWQADSLHLAQAGVRQPVPGSPSALEQAGGLHRLESGLSSGDWTDPAEHQKLAQVRISL